MSPSGGTPLAGRRVLVTRSEEQASQLIALLESAGALVVHLPAIRFLPPPTWDSLDRLIQAPDNWDWLIFTSANGVAFFADRARSHGLEPSTVCRGKIAAVGAATAGALRELGVDPDVVPSRFRGTEVLPLLPGNQKGVRTAVVRALEGRDELLEALRSGGGDVHLAIAYETRGLESLPDSVRGALVEGTIDALTFTSPSTVEHVLRHLSSDQLERVKASSRFVSIGPTTTAALREIGVDDIVEASEAGIEGLVEAVIRALA